MDTKIANFYHSIGVLKLYLRNSQNIILTRKFMENYYTSSIVNEVIETIYLFIYFFMKDILCKKNTQATFTLSLEALKNTQATFTLSLEA